MPDLVTLTIDGKQVKVAAGTLLIEACKHQGIEVPSFLLLARLVADKSSLDAGRTFWRE